MIEISQLIQVSQKINLIINLINDVNNLLLPYKEQIKLANQIAPAIILLFGAFSRNASAIILGFTLVIYSYISKDIDRGQFGDAYIMGSALADYFIVKLIIRQEKPDNVIKNLAMLLIYINLFGWICWMAYISVTLYNFLCFLVLVIITIRAITNGRNIAMDNRGGIFSYSDHPYIFNARRE